MGVKFVSMGRYLPDKVLTNFDLEKMVDTSDEWIRTRTGIKERRIAPPEIATSDMVTEAARIALDKANLKPEDIDCIIVATITPDNAYPSTACWVQKNLGLKHFPAFDISAACSGFLYGVILAKSLLETGTVKRVLLSGAETMSRVVNWEDRETCVLFGDGAGVAILELSSDESDIVSYNWAADGNLGEVLIQPAGGSRLPPSHETIDKKLHSVFMEGREVFKNAVRWMANSAEKAIQDAGITKDDIDLYVPHQANMRIIESTIKRVGIPIEKTAITIDRFANVSAATLPMTIDCAIDEGRLKRGDIVLLNTFGGGFTWGAMVVRW
ncbi:MAG: beta-ketoacyl-ACP synthase III [bacterium]|nr:beta-ketoacyl-ACP synthase III [bacterium]